MGNGEIDGGSVVGRVVSDEIGDRGEKDFLFGVDGDAVVIKTAGPPLALKMNQLRGFWTDLASMDWLN